MGPVTGQTFVDSHVVSSEGKDTSEDERIMSAQEESRPCYGLGFGYLLWPSLFIILCMTLLMKLFWNCETFWRLPHAHEGG